MRNPCPPRYSGCAAAWRMDGSPTEMRNVYDQNFVTGGAGLLAVTPARR